MHKELHPVSPATVHYASLQTFVGAIGICHTLLNQLVVQRLGCREGIASKVLQRHPLDPIHLCGLGYKWLSVIYRPAQPAEPHNASYVTTRVMLYSLRISRALQDSGSWEDKKPCV